MVADRRVGIDPNEHLHHAHRLADVNRWGIAAGIAVTSGAVPREQRLSLALSPATKIAHALTTWPAGAERPADHLDRVRLTAVMRKASITAYGLAPRPAAR